MDSAQSPSDYQGCHLTGFAGGKARQSAPIGRLIDNLPIGADSPAELSRSRQALEADGNRAERIVCQSCEPENPGEKSGASPPRASSLPLLPPDQRSEERTAARVKRRYKKGRGRVQADALHRDTHCRLWMQPVPADGTSMVATRTWAGLVGTCGHGKSADVEVLSTWELLWESLWTCRVMVTIKHIAPLFDAKGSWICELPGKTGCRPEARLRRVSPRKPDITPQPFNLRKRGFKPTFSRKKPRKPA